MKNKKIIYLSLGLLLIVATLVVSISAWLTDTKTTNSTTFTVGQVKYTITGGFIATDDPVVPGDQLLTTGSFTFTNQSTVDSELRVQIGLKLTSTEHTDIDVANATPTLLSTYFTTGAHGAGFVNPTGWVYLDTTSGGYELGYWYYETGGSRVLAPNTISFPEYSFISSLMFDGLKVGNSFATDKFEIILTIQAKQADHVLWSDLATYSFSTGLPN